MFLLPKALPGGAGAAAAPPASEEAAVAPSPVTPAFDVRVMELSFWESIKDSDNAKMFEAYLKQFPDGLFAGVARVRIEELPLQAALPPDELSAAEQDPPPPAGSSAAARTSAGISTTAGKTTGPSAAHERPGSEPEQTAQAAKPMSRSVQEVLQILEGAGHSERYNLLLQFTKDERIPGRLTVEEILALTEGSRYRTRVIRMFIDHLPGPLTYAESKKILAPAEGSNRYDLLIHMDNKKHLPEQLATNQMLELVGGSRYYDRAVALLIARVPKPLSYEDLEKILAPTKGRQRFTLIQTFVKNQFVPSGLTPEQIKTLSETSSTRKSAEAMLFR